LICFLKLDFFCVFLHIQDFAEKSMFFFFRKKDVFGLSQLPGNQLSASDNFCRPKPRVGASMRRSLAFLLPWIISWVLLSLQNQQGVVQAQNTSVAMPRKGKRARHLQNTGQGRRPASSDGGASGGAAPMQSEVDDDAGTSASALVVVVPSESDDDDDASNTSDDEYSDGYSDEDTDEDFQDESPS
jgi:hypothetical protein